VPDATPAERAAARAFTGGALNLDTADLSAALKTAYGDSYVTGLLTAAQQTGAPLATGLGQVLPATDAGWATFWDAWTPGNQPAGDLLSDGGLARMLAQVDVTVKGIEGTTLDRLGNLLADGVSQGSSVDAIAATLGGFVDNPDRAYQIANTETARAVSAASMDGYGAAGVQQVEWLVSPGACPECEDYATESPFALDDAPTQPAHPSCRCSFSPIDEGTGLSTGEEIQADDGGSLADDLGSALATDTADVAVEDVGATLADAADAAASESTTAAADPYWRETNDTFAGASFKTKATTDFGRTQAERLLAPDASAAERERVSSLLSQHPEKVVKKIQSITLAANDEAMSAAGQAVGFSKKEAGNVAAFWDGKGITMGPGFDNLTFHHEMGHAVSDFVAKSKMKGYEDAFQMNNLFDRHTDYAKTSFRESFAESYSAFVGAGSPLRRVADPHYERTFEVLRKVVG